MQNRNKGNHKCKKSPRAVNLKKKKRHSCDGSPVGLTPAMAESLQALPRWNRTSLRKARPPPRLSPPCSTRFLGTPAVPGTPDCNNGRSPPSCSPPHPCPGPLPLGGLALPRGGGGPREMHVPRKCPGPPRPMTHVSLEGSKAWPRMGMRQETSPSVPLSRAPRGPSYFREEMSNI